jgi:hypothetical protein
MEVQTILFSVVVSRTACRGLEHVERETALGTSRLSMMVRRQSSGRTTRELASLSVFAFAFMASNVSARERSKRVEVSEGRRCE